MKWLLLVALAACATGGPNSRVSQEIQLARQGGFVRVDSIVMWQNRSDVPRRYQYAFDWEGRPGAAYVAFAGDRICILPDWMVPYTLPGDRPACSPWRRPRAV